MIKEENIKRYAEGVEKVMKEVLEQMLKDFPEFKERNKK